MGKFVIKETRTGFTFRLVAGNGETIGVSEVYTTLAKCKQGIEAVKNNAIDKIEDLTIIESEKITHPKFEIYEDKAGEYRFRLKAKNGQNILASEGYKSKANCKNGIASVCKNSQSDVYDA